MVAGNTEESALGSARGRFLEGLPRKAIELRGAVALLSATPAAEGPRDDMLRRLNALYASALVFRNEPLAHALHECIERLDAARERGTALDADDLELLAAFVRRLPELRDEPGALREGAAVAQRDELRSAREQGNGGQAELSAALAADSAQDDIAPVEEPRVAAPHAGANGGSAESSATQAHEGSAEARSGDSIAALAAALREASEDLERDLSDAPAEPDAASLSSFEQSTLLRDALEHAQSPARTDMQLAASVWPSSEQGVELPLLQRVLHILLLSARSEQGEVIAQLRSDSLRLSTVNNVPELLASVRDDAPDLVLASEQLARDGALLDELRADKTTDFIPVVLFESASTSSDEQPLKGADARVARPFSGEQLMRAIGSATSTLIAPYHPAEIGDVTIEQLTQRVADEVRRGLVDAATAGRGQSVGLAGGAEVLAVTYGAVAELRAAVVRASSGRVRFAPRMPDRGPALVSLAGTDTLARGEPRLFGRRVIIVDDDTAVVLLLANLLRAQGATVHELTDGSEALAAARRERPDLVIASARAPQLDAFALSRELAREPLLTDVPVLLLPAKEQLLTRGKEPSANVQLRPELAAQVVASAAALLEPRRQIEEQLKQPGEVRGSLEGTGVIALLRSVRRTRPDVRICIRDAWNLFECELRDGRLAQVTRTACDGSFVRNERALPQLIGTRAGRFTVGDGEGAMKLSFDGTLDEVLTRGARELAAQLDAVSGPRLARVARVIFDDDAYALLVEQTPRPIRALVERLHAGEAPAKLIRASASDAAVLEPLLLDLARRGALRAVVGSAGEDLVAEAADARASELPTDLSTPLSMVPPPPNPVISVLPSADPSAERAAWTEARALPAQPAAESRSTAVLSASGEQAPLAAALADVRNPRSAIASARGRESSPSDAGELAAALADARRSRSTLAAWTVALLALGAVAFFVAREPEVGGMPVEALGGAPRSGAQRAAPSAAPPTRGSSLLSVEANGLAIYDGILDPQVAVASNQALLIVEATPLLLGATVWLNDRELGAPPQRVALPEGVHELAIKRGDAMSYRFVSVHPGRTWVLRNP